MNLQRTRWEQLTTFRAVFANCKQDLQFISPSQAKEYLGEFATVVKDTSVVIYDPGQFLAVSDDHLRYSLLVFIGHFSIIITFGGKS